MVEVVGIKPTSKLIHFGVTACRSHSSPPVEMTKVITTNIISRALLIKISTEHAASPIFFIFITILYVSSAADQLKSNVADA